MAYDFDPKPGPSPRGWNGTNREFKVTSQANGRRIRVGNADETYEYPGVDRDVDDDY